MDAALFLCQILLSAILAVSGVAKATDWVGTETAIISFGIPSRASYLAARTLPIVEIVLAVTLLIPATHWGAALGAAVLFAAFTAIVFLAIVRRNPVDCHCFGQLTSSPVTWKTIIRNLALIIVAAVIIAESNAAGTISDWVWISSVTDVARVGLTISAILLVMVCVLLFFQFQLARQNGRILLRLDALEAGRHLPIPSPTAAQSGLPVGSPAPDFELRRLHGGVLTLASELAAGLPLLLVFVDPGCGPCMVLLPELSAWQLELHERVTIVIVSRGIAEQNSAKIDPHGLTCVALQHDREVAIAYQAHATPSAVLVGADGRIASPVAAGAEAIRRLHHPLAQPEPQPNTAPLVPNGHRPPQLVPFGSRVPAVTLRTLDGKPANLADKRPATTVLLFWDPACGFCQGMLQDLKMWEANRPAGTSDLLLISTGPVETNRALGLQTTILLDDSFAAGRAVGARGTPSAIVIDKGGQIASSVVVGAVAVMSLLGAVPGEQQAPVAAN